MFRETVNFTSEKTAIESWQTNCNFLQGLSNRGDCIYEMKKRQKMGVKNFKLLQQEL